MFSALVPLKNGAKSVLVLSACVYCDGSVFVGAVGAVVVPLLMELFKFNFHFICRALMALRFSAALADGGIFQFYIFV